MFPPAAHRSGMGLNREQPRSSTHIINATQVLTSPVPSSNISKLHPIIAFHDDPPPHSRKREIPLPFFIYFSCTREVRLSSSTTPFNPHRLMLLPAESVRKVGLPGCETANLLDNGFFLTHTDEPSCQSKEFPYLTGCNLH